MAPRIHIRPFDPRHLDRIVSIEQACFGEEAWDRKLLLEYFHQSPEMFFVAQAGRRIAGYIITVRVARGAELVSIAVDPGERRRGVGRAMLDLSRAELRSRGVKSWWLMVRTTNQAAIAFYERYGFERIRLVKRYYAAKQDGWRMRLTV